MVNFVNFGVGGFIVCYFSLIGCLGAHCVHGLQILILFDKDLQRKLQTIRDNCLNEMFKCWKLIKIIVYDITVMMRDNMGRVNVTQIEITCLKFLNRKFVVFNLI